jgi:hypothetical protein
MSRILRLVPLLALVAALPVFAQSDPWRIVSDEASRVRSYLDLSESPPYVVRLFETARLGENFLWTAWTTKPSSDLRIYGCSEVSYLGVLNGSLVLRLRDWTAQLERGSVMANNLLTLLPELERASAWQTYGDRSTQACSWGTKSAETTDVVYVPLSDNSASVLLPELGSKGVVFILFHTSGATIEPRFDSWQAIQQRKQKSGP